MISVKGCADCVLIWEDHNCCHPAADGKPSVQSEVEEEGGATPDWCPLRTSAAVVQLEGGPGAAVSINVNTTGGSDGQA